MTKVTTLFAELQQDGKWHVKVTREDMTVCKFPWEVRRLIFDLKLKKLKGHRSKTGMYRTIVAKG